MRSNLGPKVCWQFPPPGPPTQIQITANPPSGADAGITYRNPKSSLFDRVVIVRKFGSCATGTADGDKEQTAWGAANTDVEVEDADEQPLLPGSHCYSFWSYDRYGRPSARATVWMHGYQDLFPAPTGLSVQVQPEPGVTAHLQWTNNSSPFLDTAYVQRRPGTCGVQDYWDHLAALDWVEAEPGQGGFFDDSDAATPGTHCYAVWSTSFELAERHSRVPTTAQVTIP